MNDQINKKSSFPVTHLLYKERIPFNAMIANISFSKGKRSYVFETLILFIEYAQLFSQYFLIVSPLITENSSILHMLMMALTLFAKILTPGSLFEFDRENYAIFFVFSILLLFLVIKYGLLTYVTIVSFKGYEALSILVTCWRWIFKLHGRVLYHLLTSFWVSLALALLNQSSNLFGFETGIVIFSIGIIIMEYMFSILINVRYKYILPSKSFLSSKDNKKEILNITTKFMIQMLQFTKPSNPLTISLIFILPSLILNLITCQHYFKTLPLYNIKALYLEGSLLMILTWINLCHLLCFVIDFLFGIKISIDSTVLIWLLVIPLVIKFTLSYIETKGITLVTGQKSESVELLLHKIIAVKKIWSCRRPYSENLKKIRESDLFHMSYSACSNIVFYSKNDNGKSNLNSKASLNMMILAYLENLLLKFPNNQLLKLYFAYYNGIKMQLYGAAIRILFDMLTSCPSQINFTAYALLGDIQARMNKESNRTESKLDLSAYISNLVTIMQLKEKILNQTDLQIQVCKQFIQDVPDLAKIFSLSQHIVSLKFQIEKKLEKISESIKNPSFYMLAARYHLTLNHSLADYDKFSKLVKIFPEKYCHKKKNYLCQENLQDSNNCFILVTGQTKSSGRITFCSNSENIFGRDLSGCPAYIIAPPILQNFYFEFFRNPLDQANQALIGRVLRTFAYHKHGHLIEIDFYLNIHPFLSQGLYYNLIIHPIRSSKDFLILNEQGSIEGFTKKVGEKLGLLSRKRPIPALSINIQQISKELFILNEVSNIVAREHQGTSNQIEKEEISLISKKQRKYYQIEEAKMMFSNFNSERRILKLSAVKDKELEQSNQLIQNSTYSYHCKIEYQFYGSTLIKLVTLEEAELKEIENYNEKDPNISKSGGISIKSKSKTDDIKDLSPKTSNHNSQEFNKYEGSTTQSNLIFTQGRNLFKVKNTDSRSLNINKTEEQEKCVIKLIQDEKEEIDKLERVEKSLGSQKSKISTKIRTAKVLKDALSVPYYPKYYNTFTIVFYLLIIGIFITQINLEVILNNDLTNRKGRKDVIRNAEIRNNLLIGVQRQFMYMFDIRIGRLKENDVGLFSQPVSSYVKAIRKDIIQLSQINNDLLLATESLDLLQRDNLFERDVKIYELSNDGNDEKYINLNNFQATERIIESTSKALNLIIDSPEEAKLYIDFICRNTLNDLLVKIEEITDIFIKAFDIEAQTILNKFILILISGLIIVIFLFVVTFAAIIVQYNAERDNMLIFMRLSQTEVRKFIDRLNTFKFTIQQDKLITEINRLNRAKDEKLVSKLAVVPSKFKRAGIKSVNYNGIFVKYSKHFLNLILIISILAIYIVIRFTLVSGTINSLRENLGYLYFSDHLRTRLNLALITSHQLVTKDIGSMIKNKPVTVQIKFAVQDVKNIRMEIPYAFSKEFLIKNRLIEEIIFSDGCKYMTDFAAKGCEAQIKGAKKMSLLTAAADLEKGVSERYYGYISSDRSPQSLVKIQVSTFNQAVHPNIIIGGESTLISNIINNSYEEEILQTKNCNKIFWGIICGILATISIFAWYSLLGKIKQADNEFKNVLHVFPINLVLSNVMLKNYLIKASKGALRFINNQI